MHPKANLYGALDGISSLVPYLNSKGETSFIAANLVKNYYQSGKYSTKHLDYILGKFGADSEFYDVEETSTKIRFAKLLSVVDL